MIFHSPDKQPHSMTTKFRSSSPIGQNISELYGANKKVDGQQKTILVVDDEQLIQSLITDILESVNFRVVTANNGQMALDIYNENPQQFDLIILDMIMPILDGEKTFHQLMRINPQQKVLICSGYNNVDDVQNMLESGAIGLLSKPFTLDTLFHYLESATS